MAGDAFVVPLSFAQRSIWYTARVGDCRGGYTGIELRIRGNLDVPAMLQSLQDVLRHSLLAQG